MTRRTHATLMRRHRQDRKTVTAQMGDDIGVNLRIYTQVPVDIKAAAVAKLEAAIREAR